MFNSWLIFEQIYALLFGLLWWSDLLSYLKSARHYFTCAEIQTIVILYNTKIFKFMWIPLYQIAETLADTKSGEQSVTYTDDKNNYCNLIPFLDISPCHRYNNNLFIYFVLRTATTLQFPWQQFTEALHTLNVKWVQKHLLQNSRYCLRGAQLCSREIL